MLRPRYLSLLNTGVVLRHGAPIRRECGSVRCQKLPSCVRAVGPASLVYFIFLGNEGGGSAWLSTGHLVVTAVVLMYGMLPRSSCASHIFVVMDSVFNFFFRVRPLRKTNQRVPTGTENIYNV
jgi:hypothetical protein